MRQIKFRAWDKRNNRMLQEWILDDFSNWVKYPDWYNIMQFTGLKDKNGKEIYELDIIKIPNTEQYSRVYFDKGCFMIENYHEICIKIRGRFETISSVPLRQEVIGNIYENPELIK